MSAHHCCQFFQKGSGRDRLAARGTGCEPHPPTLARRCLDSAGWIGPSVILTLLPKCPACLAAYIAIGTGIGLSMSTATYLRMLIVSLCVAALLYLVTRRAHRFISQIFTIKTSN